MTGRPAAGNSGGPRDGQELPLALVTRQCGNEAPGTGTLKSLSIATRMPEALGCSARVRGAVHPDGHGQADDDKDDGQDQRRPAEYQAYERQAGPIFSGSLDLVP